MVFFESILEIFIDMSLYMLIGMLLSGILNEVLKKDTVAKYLGAGKRFAAVKGALLGVPMPICSCGVLPMTAYLGKSGAQTSAVMAFLISTPQTGLDSVIATLGMLGVTFAVYTPIVTFISGAAGGAIIQKIAGNGIIGNIKTAAAPCTDGCGGCGEHQTVSYENSCDVHESTEVCSCGGCGEKGCAHRHERRSLIDRIKRILRYAFADLLDDISLHFVIGVLIAGVITLLIPEGFFTKLNIASGIAGMLVMLVIGLPMYICSTSSIPVALAFIAKGISPGAAFVFLFAGPATNAASVAMLLKIFGKKTVAIYLAVLAVFAVGFGLLLDGLISWLSLPAPAAGAAQAIEAPGIINIIAGVLFGALLLRSLVSKLLKAVKIRREAKS